MSSNYFEYLDEYYLEKPSPTKLVVINMRTRF